jgi:hypothetical protein
MARQVKHRGIEEYLRRDVEVRTLGGGAFRGHLEAVDEEFVYLTRGVGRGAVIPREAIAAVLDEERFAAPGNGNLG